MNKRYRRNYCGGHVADSGKQTDNRIEGEAELRSGDAQEVIHNERKPPEKRFKRGASPAATGSSFRREDFPVQGFRFLIFDFRLHVIPFRFSQSKIANRDPKIISPEFP